MRHSYRRGACVLGRAKRHKRRDVQLEEDSIDRGEIEIGVSGGRGRSRDGLGEVSLGQLKRSIRELASKAGGRRRLVEG